MWSIMLDYKKYISVLLLVFVVGCQENTLSLQKHTGRALGTTYLVQYQGQDQAFVQNQKAFDSLFQTINQSMSTYWPESLISQINRGNDSVVIDTHFKAVYQKATQVWQASNGFFDPTIGSLVNAYGFGPEKGLGVIDDATLDSLLAITGWDKLRLTDAGTITKFNKSIYIDFNAIAKGYTVDAIGNYLAAKGYTDFLVEIGGELVARGNSPRTGQAWKVAIDDPQQGETRRFTSIISLQNEALATSGNYRKFRVDSLTGEKYVHTLNPKTGRPVRSNILSTSVRAADCMTADAWATTLMVLPLEEGRALINARPDLAAFWIISEDKEVKEVQSTNW